MHDPADICALPEPGDDPHPVEIADPTGADRFVLRRLVDFDPPAASPLWLRARLHLAGMRPVSLAVDVTNYVMLELGQPLHAFDGTLLRGPIVVRRARAGERLETLDHVIRALDAEDLLITDDRGPIALAGTMGGWTPRSATRSTEIVLEAAHFDPVAVARETRRHKLSSEASRRFERGVDPTLGPVAALAPRRCSPSTGARGSSVPPRSTGETARAPIEMDADYPGRVAGLAYDAEDVVRRLEQVGCSVTSGAGAADGAAAAVAAGPARSRRPRRGGHPARGLRAHPVPAAACAAGARLHRAAAALPHGDARLGRAGIRRGAGLPVHRRGGR